MHLKSNEHVCEWTSLALGCVHVSEGFYEGAAILMPSTLAELTTERQTHDFKNIGKINSVMLTPPSDTESSRVSENGDDEVSEFESDFANWLKRARREIESESLKRSVGTTKTGN